MNHSRIAEVLTKARLVDELQLRSAIAKQGQWGGRLARHVVDLGFAEEGAVADALAQACGLQRVALGAVPRDAAALSKVDLAFAEEKGVFPYALRDNGKTLWIAMADPCDIGVVDEIAARSGCRVRSSVAGEREIVAAIYRHYRNQEPPAALMGQTSRLPRTPTEEPMTVVDMQGNGLDVPAAWSPPAPSAPAAAPARRPTPQPAPAAPPAFDPFAAMAGPRPAAPTPAPFASPTPAAFQTPTPAAFARPTPAAFPAPTPAAFASPAPARRATPAGGLPVDLPPEVAASVTPAVAEYLRGLHADLEKTSTVLRSLIDLGVAKGLFSGEEIKTVIARLTKR